MAVRSRVIAGTAAGMGALTLLVYLSIIINEANDSALEVLPWAIWMAAASSAAALGALKSWNPPLLVAGILFVLIGLPAIFSVGLPLIVAGVLCLSAYSPSRSSTRAP